MAGITLSAGVKQNLLSLQNTANLMATTQNRLATGKKVNTALDNPTNFFTSSSLQARAGDMNSLLDSMSNGIKTLEAADNGLSAITKTVESMQSTLRQARQDKSFKTSSYTIDSTTIGAASVKTIGFSGGAVGTTPVTVDINDKSVTAVQGTVVTKNSSYVAPAAATASEQDFTFGSTLDFDNAGDQFTFKVAFDGKAAQTITIDAAAVTAALGGGATKITSATELATVINDIGLTDGTVAANGATLTFTSATTGTASDVVISATGVTDAGGAALTNTSGISDVNATNGTAAVADKAITINGVNITLNATNGADAVTAAATIQSALSAQGITATGNNTDGTIDLAGPADGSVDIAISGADADTVFGVVGDRTVVAAVAGDAGGADTVDELVSAINATTALQGKVRASNDNGKLRIENQSTSDLTVTGIGSDGELDGTSGTATIGGNEVRKNLVKQFNELRDQLNKLADDSSFNGVNLLRGDKLKLTFNETGTSTMEIQAKTSAGVATSVNASNLNISSAVDADFDSDTSLDGRLEGLQTSLNTLRSQASTFGSNLSIVQNRQDFTKSMIATLQTGADKLVLADTNEEAANMLALQTRQQLSSTALSLASQADQAALRLF